MNKKNLIDLTAFLLIALVLLVGYKLSPMILGKADVTLFPNPSCDLQRGPCFLDLPEGARLVLSLGDQPVPLIKPFPVSVHLKGLTATRVSIDFDGEDMKMGLNRTDLAATGPGIYTGSATLPICVTGRMLWRATVMVETGRQRIAAPFLFESPAAVANRQGEQRP